MRLKSIKLAGFKSFVDPTTLELPTNLTAIVGPNGCGKSNTIDAVRWVMGESSAKNLRGESMTDVIFNGSNTRKPVGQASIELIFDNSDGTLTGEYAAFNEISIRRKVTREGDNSYYLNGVKCRRRDITDIFLGTGLGPRSYAIIEQGMISKLIEAKPEELRVFIEEAAGISKYKERRKDTESRIKRTRENLDRLNDIREELDRQLQHLKRQSAAAERYTELKRDERRYKAQLQALQWRALDRQVNEVEGGVQALSLALEEVLTRQQGMDTNIEKLRLDYTDVNDQFNQVQSRYYALGADIAKLEQAIQFQKDRQRQLREDLEVAERTYREGLRLLEVDRESLESWRDELEAVGPELELLREQEAESAELLAQAEDLMQDWQQRWDSFNQRASEPRQRAEVQQSRIQHLEQSQSRLRERIGKLEEEKAGLVSRDDDEEIEQLREQLAELELAQEESQGRQEENSEQIDARREQNNQLQRELDQGRSELQRMRGRHASLEALQQAALGRQGGAVQGWLKQHGLAEQPRLAERLQAAEGWERAVETALGDYLQAVCVDGLDAAGGWLADFQAGSVALFDGAVLSAPAVTLAEPLLSKASGVEGIAGLLAGIYCAEGLPEALVLRPRLQAHESVMTRDGIWLGPNWLRVARDRDEQAGVLQRQQELASLNEDMAALDDRVEAWQATLDEGRQRLREQEQAKEQLAREINEHNRRQGELRSQLSARQVRLEQIAVRRQRTEHEIQEAREQYRLEQENLAEARAVLQEAIDAMASDSLQREDLLRVRDDARLQLDDTRQRARHQRDQMHQFAMREQSLRTKVESITLQIERTQQQVQQMQSRKLQIEESLSGGDEPIEENRLELEVLLERRLRLERELGEARNRVEEVEHKLRNEEKMRGQIEQEAQAVRGKLEQARLGSQELQLRRQALEELLAEDELLVQHVLSELPEEATEARWQEELTLIAGRISRLGPINLAAIDEFKIQSERKGYLDRQHEDLNEALLALENAIRKIDRETRTRFKDTFEQVNKGLQELFPTVFGGGHAYLELTGDDLLDTGVAIMARPPGKRNSTIHLLSGGEKALTAIALVFSIFRLNPAPFCMLDEVDAPLDDANVGRYARLVKDMSSKVQFIYITHNKIAMEMAHQLMGVTMHEPGVSRLVSVDIDEATELAAL